MMTEAANEKVKEALPLTVLYDGECRRGPGHDRNAVRLAC